MAVPVGSMRFCAETAVATSCGDSPRAFSASGSRSTTICRTLPPIGSGKRVPCTMLSMVRTRWLTWSKISASRNVSLLNDSCRMGTLLAV